MSGTSLDAADAAVVDLSSSAPALLAAASRPIEPSLRSRLLALCASGSDGLDAFGECSVELARLYAAATADALRDAGIAAHDVAAIGCHGQTVRHRPERGFTLQLNDPALLAELTGIDVVADFRRRDVAAGGQGAPLAPLFHDAVFRSSPRQRAIVNIGGISNATILHAGKAPTGFDCGPGNLLMDHWVSLHAGKPFDENGAWAQAGSVVPALLNRLLEDPYLAAPPPKSTGREHYGPQWLSRQLGGDERAVDVQATLLELTALAITRSIERFAPGTDEVFVCGGGARNGALMGRIAALLPGSRTGITDDIGVDARWVEAVAFAWMAKCCIDRQPLPLGPVTGARHPCVLGAIYPR